MIGIWVLIDLGVLIDLLAIVIAIPKPPHPTPLGLEMVVLIAYFPVVMPLGLAVPQWFFPPSVGTLVGMLGPVGVNVIDAWIAMTLIAALQSTLIVGTVRTVRYFVRRSRASSEGI
jgi:hypothetical protein